MCNDLCFLPNSEIAPDSLCIWYDHPLWQLMIMYLYSDITLYCNLFCFSINYWNWDFQIMLGLSYAARSVQKAELSLYIYIPSWIKYFTNFLCSICVGNELGAGHQKVARFSVIVVVMASITFSIFVTLLVITLSTLYTSSTTVIEAVNSLMPLLAFSIFLNGIQPILSGTEGEHIQHRNRLVFVHQTSHISKMF